MSPRNIFDIIKLTKLYIFLLKKAFKFTENEIIVKMKKFENPIMKTALQNFLSSRFLTV